MDNSPGIKQLELLEQQMEIESPLPNASNAEQRLIIYSHMFRDRSRAIQFAKSVQLGKDESLIGGNCEDSIGRLWWIGVKTENVEQWHSNGGYHRAATLDPEIPGCEML
ncbi:MAG: hypothetical protein R3240_09785 [Gammaproteobacteria bacterium]|nr:hypothetical protein [Gammaproteobacteria bacterium]